MNKNFSKTIKIACCIALLASSAFGLNSEYKNSLVKVELVKNSDSAYNINLYTEKNFAEPVKVIKKSDLNYYVLLPETNNSLSSVVSDSEDIKSISTKLYPYAGADIKNGYTKIDINTSKPINFNIVTKNVPQNKAQSSPSQNKLAQLPTAKPVQVQTSSDVKTQNSKNQTTAKKETKTATKNTVQKTPPKAVEPKKQETKTKTKLEPVPTKSPVLEDDSLKPIQDPEKDFIDDLSKFMKNIESDDETETIIQEEEVNEQEIIDEVVEPKKDKINPKEFIKSKKIFVSNAIKKTKQKLSSCKRKLSNKLDDYGISFSDILLMGLAGLFSFIVVLFILSRKQQQPKLKSKADLVENKTKANDKSSKKQKTTQEVTQPKNNGEYFVFDNETAKRNPNIPKTKNTIKNLPPKPVKNYALSSYNPKKQPSSKLIKINKDYKENEIINKILKEDAYIDLEPQQQAKLNKRNVRQPQVQQVKQQTVPLQQKTIKTQVRQQAQLVEKKIQKEDTATASMPIEAPKIVQEPKTIQKSDILDKPQVVQEQKQVQQAQTVEQPNLAEQSSIPVLDSVVEPEPIINLDPSEPKVLSRVEYAPSRGFMCVSFENSVRLLGYIFDDVFAVYNFKKPELNDYNIQYRLSEQTDKDTTYIVKIEKTKLVITVTSTSMNLEVVM